MFTKKYEKVRRMNKMAEHEIIKFDRLKLERKYRTVIYLVRHGESLGNAKREFLGHTDKSMSDLGVMQAARTAEFLAYNDIDVIYSSDLKRAYETAQPHAALRGLDIISSKGLREIFAGKWEGMRVEDIISKYPVEFLDQWRDNFGMSTPVGGESVQELGHRIYENIHKIAKANEGKSILIASHAAAIRSFWAIITGTPYEKLAQAFPFPTNASVSVVYFDDDTLLPGEYSHDAHLTGLI